MTEPYKESMERIEGILLGVGHGLLTERRAIALIWDVFHAWSESSNQKDFFDRPPPDAAELAERAEWDATLMDGIEPESFDQKESDAWIQVTTAEERQGWMQIATTAEERQALLDHLTGTDDKRLRGFLKAVESCSPRDATDD